MDDTKDKVVTPLVAPHDKSKSDAAPKTIDTDAPVSTDADGTPVELPDLGGKID